MKHEQRQARRAAAIRRRPAALAAALALALAGAAGSATAAVDNTAAIARALAHIQAFPGRTLHGDGQTYSARDVIVDADGAEHVRVERRYKGLRVIGGDMVVHSGRGGAFVDVTRTLREAPALDVQARLAQADAVAAAAGAHAGMTLHAAPELVVWARGAQPVLAYDVTLSGTQADGTPSRLHVMVDARSGALLEHWDEIETAPAVGSGQSLFLGSVPLNTTRALRKYRLTDGTRGNSSTLDMKNRTSGSGTLFTDADNLWGDGTTANRQTVAVDAAFGAAITWDYYLNVHGRNGIANDGTGANTRVHYGNNYANAFWDDNCFCMTYGDGNASLYPLVSLDVAGHEMSHGVTSRTAGLVYAGESGGLNEATSDIMGTNVEFYANDASDPGDYLIGEMLYKGGGWLRSMIHPSADGASSDCWYSTVGNLDVHYSSGVANHFYYLLSEGTVGGQPSPTCVAGNTRAATGSGTVAAIGRAKAEKIWYRALTVYMTSSTKYSNARAATLSAAADLYGAGSPEVDAVAAAWSAVNVN